MYQYKKDKRVKGIKMNFKNFGLLAIMTVLLSACGTTQQNSLSDGKTEENKEIVQNPQKSDNEQNATIVVDIYEVQDNGTISLKWHEYSKDSTIKNGVQNFDKHTSSLDADKFYIYQAKELKTDKVIRAIDKGKNIIEAGDTFNLTYISEVLYESVAGQLLYHFDKSDFKSYIEDRKQKISKEANLLTFSAGNDEVLLTPFYKKQSHKFQSNIQAGEYALFDTNTTLSFIDLNNSISDIVISKDEKRAYVKGSDELYIIDISNPLDIFIISRYSGKYMRTMILSQDETKLFVGSNQKIIILDISNPADISKVAQIDHVDNYHYFSLSKDEKKLYLREKSKVTIFDISQLETPQVIATIQPPNDARTQHVQEVKKDIFCIIFEKSISFYKIENQEVKEIGTYESDRYNHVVKKMVFSKDASKMFIMEDREFFIYDIADFSQVKLLDEIVQTTIFDSNFKDILLDKSENKALLLLDGNGGIMAIDIEDKNNIKKIAKFDDIYNPFFRNIVCADDEGVCYGSSTYTGLIKIDAKEYFNYPANALENKSTRESGYIAIEKENIENIIQFKTMHYYMKRNSVYKSLLSKDASKAYVIMKNGFLIIDLTTKTDPLLVRDEELIPLKEGINLSKDGTKAYMLSQDSDVFTVYDVKNPKEIVSLKELTKRGALSWASNPKSMVLSDDGTKAYITDAYAGLVIVDITNPDAPLKIGSKSFGNTINVLIFDKQKIAYMITERDSYLYILDISDPTHITSIDQFNTHGRVESLTYDKERKRVFLRDKTGIFIFDVADCKNPKLLGTYSQELRYFTNKIAFSKDGTKLFIPNSYDGFFILDIADMENIKVIFSVDSTAAVEGVKISKDGTKLYIADGTNGIIVYDISDFSHIKEIRRVPTFDIAYDIEFFDNEKKVLVYGLKKYGAKQHKRLYDLALFDALDSK